MNHRISLDFVLRQTTFDVCLVKGLGETTVFA